MLKPRPAGYIQRWLERDAAVVKAVADVEHAAQDGMATPRLPPKAGPRRQRRRGPNSASVPMLGRPRRAALVWRTPPQGAEAARQIRRPRFHALGTGRAHAHDALFGTQHAAAVQQVRRRDGVAGALPRTPG
jgi:hypothetical protein